MEDKQMEIIENDEFIEGFALSGDFVDNLEDKHFTIDQKPYYEIVPDFDNPEKQKKKLILIIKLTDGSIVKYYPNKTSQKSILNKAGFKLDGWVGYEGEFEIKDQKVGKEDKKVIYIKE